MRHAKLLPCLHNIPHRSNQPQQRDRRATMASEDSTLMCCTVCEATAGSELVRLLPCRCTVCKECLFQAHIRRGLGLLVYGHCSYVVIHHEAFDESSSSRNRRRPVAQDGVEDDVTPVLLQLPTDQRVLKMLRAMFVAVFDSFDKSNDAELLFASVKLLSRSRC